MALKEKTDYAPKLTVKHHAFCLESKEPKEGYKAIEVENPKSHEKTTKYVKLYDAIDGYINKIEWYSREHENEVYRGLNVYIADDAGFEVVLDLPLGRRVFETFLRFAGNIDYEKPVVLKAFKGRDGNTAFYATQDGVTVKWRHTRDEPNGCPAPKQSKITGKWDFAETTEWLLEQVLDHIAPQVAAIAANRSHSPQASQVLKANTAAVNSGYPPLNSKRDPQANKPQSVMAWDGEDDLPPDAGYYAIEE